MPITQDSPIQNPNHIIQTIPTNKIIDFLSDRGIKLSVNDIITPKAHTIEHVYTEILTVLKIPLPTTSNHQLGLFFLLKNLFNRIGTKTFKFSDMSNIGNTKFPFYLSQLINFISHREAIKEYFDDIENQLAELNSQKAVLQGSLKEKEKILKSVKFQEVQNLANRETLIQKIEETKQTTKQLKDNLATLMIEYKETKSLRDAAMTTNSEKKMLILNLKKERDILSDLVVSDNSIHTNLVYYRSEIPKLRHELETLSEKLHESNEALNKAEAENRQLTRIAGGLNEIERVDESLMTLKNTKIDLKMKNSNLTRALDFLVSKRETNKKQILQIEEERESLQKNAARFSREFKILMNGLRNQIDTQKNESFCTKKQKERIKVEISRFKNGVEERQKEIEVIESKLTEKLESAKEEIDRLKIEHSV